VTVQKKKNGDVTFICDVAPEAKKVFLVGSFNEWDPNAKRMSKSKDGTFRAKIKLPPGKHEYKFVADGDWIQDPKAEEQVTNQLGTLNSVVNVN